MYLTNNKLFPSRVVELLLHHDARPGIRDDDGYNAVHYASLKGHKLSLEMLLDAAPTDLLRSGAAYTPGHLAAYNGHNEALLVLLGYMMNVDVMDSNGEFMIHDEC